MAENLEAVFLEQLLAELCLIPARLVVGIDDDDEAMGLSHAVDVPD